MLLFHALTMSAAHLLLCFVAGLGLALFLPATLRNVQLLLAPAIGLALLAILGFYGTVAGLTLRQILPLALLLALALLGLRLKRGSSWGYAPNPMFGGGEAAPELPPIGLSLILLATWGLSVAPALAKGSLMPLGYGMDVEFYMGLAAYLKDYSYVNLIRAPSSPMQALISNPYIGQIAFGAAYVQGMADLLGGWEAWHTWVPMQANLRVMALLALYALLRGSLQMPASGALIGTALCGINSLLLWLTYNNFSASLAGLVVVLAALAITWPALHEGDHADLLIGAILIGGLACLYWPMLTAFGALGAGLGLAALWANPQRGAVIWRGVVLLGLGALVGWLPNLRSPHTFPGLFAASTAYMGIADFVAPQVLGGMLRFTHLEHVTPAVWEQNLADLGLIALSLGLGWGVWRSSSLPLRGLTAFALIYILGLRWMVGYPYGYFRGVSYVMPMLLGVVGAGLALLWQAGRPQRMLAGVLGLVILAAAGSASSLTLRSYSTIPPVYTAESNQLAALPSLLERPGAIFFSSAAAEVLCGVRQSAWAYWLREHPLQGDLRGSFGASVQARDGTMAYAVLLNGEDPTAHGLASAPIWQDHQVRIYSAPLTQRAWLAGLDRYLVPPACNQASTNLHRINLGLGNYLSARPAAALDLYANGDALSFAPLPPTNPTTGSIRLALIAFSSQSLDLELGGTTRRIALRPGLQIYQTEALALPLKIRLRPQQDAVMLRWVSLEETTNPAIQHEVADLLLLQTNLSSEGSVINLDLHSVNHSPQALRMAIEIYAEVSGYTTPPTHYAGGIMPLPRDGSQQIRLDLHQLSASLNATPISIQPFERTDGRYFAALWIYQGEEVLRQIPIARFEQQDGQIRNLETINYNAVIIPLAREATPVGATIGTSIGLSSYSLSSASLRPGANLHVGLLWKALGVPTSNPLVFVQLLGPNAEKVAQWDGHVGGDWYPSGAWQPNMQIWQDIPLRISAEARAGTYQLVVGVYDPSTGARWRVSSGGDMITLGMVEIGP
ncbi:hypothetical protein [Candidatus Oscillochloris fontis]|uniref:hypothetical protein n=1 Tax=Candidatus Oscillochloris fontis TaxID=2496868 RepID=UPI00101C7201|nr:hypothetical protein [Candidatus Oscillochloris fontis]